MKKTTKSLLITALILLCAGLLLALSSALFTKVMGIDPYGVEQKAKVIETKSISLDDILSVSQESNFVKKLSTKEFSKIDVLSFAGNVVICSDPGETRIQLDHANTNNLSWEIVGETLMIKEEDPVGFLGFYIDENGFSFQGLRHIFGPGNSANSGKTVTVYLSSKIKLDQVNVHSTIGDVTVDGVFSENLSISASTGNVCVKNLQSENGKISIEGNVVDVLLENNAYSNCTVSTRIGSIKAGIPKGDNQSTVLDVWMGNVNLNTDLPTSYYKLSFSTMFGTITRNGQTAGKSLSDSSSTASRISSTIILGSASISYSGGDESSYVPPEKPESVPESEEKPSQEPNLPPQDNEI